MVGWRRKCKVKKKVNSVNGGKKKRMKEDAKRTRESQKVGGQNSALTLKTQLGWLSQLQKKFFFFDFSSFLFFSFLFLKKFIKREASYRFPKKKKKERKENSWSGLRIKYSLSNSKSQIFNSKFSFPSLKLHILNFKFNLKFQVSKFQIASFQNLKF